MQNLFTPYPLADLDLANRIVMAPMTRSRAINNLPNELMATYYNQRADAGLIITEGTSPSPNGLGYARGPGIYSEEQVQGWKLVTSAVREKDAKIFAQIMHTGRVGHPDNLPNGGTLVAPSAVPLETTRIWVDGKSSLEVPVAKELTADEVQLLIEDHIQAARNAVRAGFDGIELHGANGYLIKQFLNPHTNRRTDDFGGSIENRSRFVLEVVRGISRAIGNDKVGIRISPFAQHNETPPYPEAEATYLYLAKKLNDLGIAYLHISDPFVKGQPHDLAKNIRKVFRNTLILSGGYTAESAEQALKNGHADLVSFARPFIPNPDLVHRFRSSLPLNQPKFDLFYSPGPEGYVDYPEFKDVQVV